MSAKTENEYMETQSQMKSAICEYVKAARAMDLDDARIAEDIADALNEEGIKLESARIE